MLTNYIIVEKFTGHYGRSDIRVVQGTEMMITRGQLQIWNSEREGALARRPVLSIPVERVVSFKQQVNKAAGAGEDTAPETPAQLNSPTPHSQVA